LFDHYRTTVNVSEKGWTDQMPLAIYT
jgi:hypothetical protein